MSPVLADFLFAAWQPTTGDLSLADVLSFLGDVIALGGVALHGIALWEDPLQRRHPAELSLWADRVTADDESEPLEAQIEPGEGAAGAIAVVLGASA